jgi:hypothetical protein
MALTYEPIGTVTFNNTFSTTTFSSIPSTYTDLRLVVVSTIATGTSELRARFNGDTAGNYSFTYIAGDGASSFSGYDPNRTSMGFGGFEMGTNKLAFYTLDVFSYAGSTFKTSLGTESNDQNIGGGLGAGVGRRVNCWRSTSAVTSLTVFSLAGTNFSSGNATLYGIKAA